MTECFINLVMYRLAHLKKSRAVANVIADIRFVMKQCVGVRDGESKA